MLAVTRHVAIRLSRSTLVIGLSCCTSADLARDRSLGRCPGPHEKGVPKAWREAIWKLTLGLMDFYHHEA